MYKLTATAPNSLRDIYGIKPIYLLPDDPLTDDVLIPAFTAAKRVDSMMGFFTSASLKTIAPGLATFINDSTGKLRLIVSPILRQDDLDAIQRGISDNDLESLIEQSVSGMTVTADLIEQYTLQCLSWLIRENRIEMKVALMKDAILHTKVWMFFNGDEALAVHGSGNMTQSGLQKNIEQIAVARSWEHPDHEFTVARLSRQFNSLWNDADPNSIVVDMPTAIRRDLVRNYSSVVPPQESTLRDLYKRASVYDSTKIYLPEVPERTTTSFEIPAWLKYEEGDFAHQGEAVNAWLDAGRRGILEMATGSGKTITAMICARRLFEDTKPLLIVVAAPYVPLVDQWCDEMRPFGIEPLNVSAINGCAKRDEELGRLRRMLRRHRVQAVVVTHDMLCREDFQAKIKQLRCETLLVADEVHNLGRPQFVDRPPEFFRHRLGLSATLERQYDREGTDGLLDFFGEPVYSFALDQAIGKCLVEYDYYVHPVELTTDELEGWHTLTDKIRANAWRSEGSEGNGDEFLQDLYRKRRIIIENAEGKSNVLGEILDNLDFRALKHTLIYTSDKNPKQMDEVNQMLNDRGVLFHQLTYEETPDRSKVAAILESFQSGQLGVLTAKRVLDEGVNIPQVQRAYILASTTVERQWVQRRGRLLRLCPQIGKTHSEIHDFVVVPPPASGEERSMARSELHRVQEFASLARNAGAPDGPLEIIAELIKAAYY